MYHRRVTTEGWIFMVGFRIFDGGLLIMWFVWFFRLRDDDDSSEDDGPGGGGNGPGPGRGPGGGHTLARPADGITLVDLISALEGPTATGEESAEPRRSDSFALRELWKEVNQQVEQVLRTHTLADLVERERQRAFTYYI